MKALSVLHLLMLTGRLFHRVAAVFRTEISGILLEDKQQQILLSTEGHSHIELYVNRPGSCTLTCIWLEGNAGVQNVLFVHVYGPLVYVYNSVFSVHVNMSRYYETKYGVLNRKLNMAR